MHLRYHCPRRHFQRSGINVVASKWVVKSYGKGQFCNVFRETIVGIGRMARYIKGPVRLAFWVPVGGPKSTHRINVYYRRACF